MKPTAIRYIRIVAALLVMTFVATTARAATITSTAAGGSWNAATTWVGGVIPTLADNAQIFPGATVTVLSDAAANSMTFLSSKTNTGTLSVGSGVTLNVTGGITLQNSTTNKVSAVISGAGTINCASVNVGGTTIPTLGNLTTTLTSTIAFLNVTGNLTIAGYDGGSSSQDKPAFNLSSGFVSVGGTVALTESGSPGGPAGAQTLSMATGSQSGTLKISGTPAFSLSANVSGAVNGANATVIYAGAAQTIVPAAYNNLILENPGLKTLGGGGGFSVTGALSINDGAVFNLPAKISVTSLYLDGERQTGNGKTFGGAGSGANFINNDYFTGNGTLKDINSTTGTATILTRTAGSSSSIYGGALTFHAAITGGIIPIPNGDTVTFRSGSTVIGTATTTGGTADLTLYNLPAGSNQIITATFNGDSTLVFSASAGVSQTVAPKALYIAGLSAANKLFDGSATATLSGTATLLSADAAGGSTVDGHPYTGDTVSLSSTAAAAFTGTFSSTNTGMGIVVKITGNSLVGAQAANYVLATPDEANGAVMANFYDVPGTSSIGSFTAGSTNVINAGGVPNYTYILERSINLPGNWVAVSTNTAGIDGSISASDTFSDLGGTRPPHAFYRLNWQP
jgi:hypothetical protein